MHDGLKAWYLRNLRWERKHRKSMICIRVFAVLLAIAVNARLIQIVLRFYSLSDAIPIFVLFYSAVLVTLLLIYFLFRKLKKTGP